jgi:glucuronate isomerase
MLNDWRDDMCFIHENFILNNKVAQDLYHNYASKMPIIDYHCHLEPKDIAENKRFETIYDLWLAGDHYKWRQMRANGVEEKYITGDAAPIEKFKAWCETVESCIGNPLYHWTHLELKNYFGITDTLGVHNYKDVWDKCNSLLKKPEYSAQGLIGRSNVEVVCTTDSPLDNLEYHRKIKAQSNFKTKVLPTFRPDEALDSEGEAFKIFIKKLSELTNKNITNFSDFLLALENRIDFFHENGCRLSDHGLMKIEFLASDTQQQEALFAKKLQGLVLTANEKIVYRSAVLTALAKFYATRNWAMQIHFGVIRNNNSIMLSKTGINTGFDSICDQTDLAIHLNAFLNSLNQQDALPKIIIYNLDASLNDVVATTIANFQKAGSVKSNMQFGSGWWFNDTKRGMLRQLTTLADQGLLMNFVGMLTDSRSFISYTRHEYFRRILCNLIGQWVTDGEIPHDNKLLEKLITGICYQNAKNYFQF